MASRGCSFCLAIIACLLIFFAGRFGIANLYAVGLEQMQHRWAVNGSANEQELKNASILAHRMLSLHAEHPHYNSLAASQAQWLLLSGIDSEEKRKKLLSVASNYYRASIEQRPGWPDSYARLAKIEWQQGAGADRMFQLMATSQRFGPFDATTLYGMAEIGLANWSILTSEQRMDVFDAVLQAMAHYQTRSHMERIVTSPLQKERGCRLLALNNLTTKRCGVTKN
ncbi:VpsP family polysaccharide biosynthesis protein [Photobacterium sagamiensis]|uniref:VpsP family polysaccharide biosynthesis protein n=1 Tax=Photobacterium sagamiensis TaxID=2910241 RepID=UPI003D12FBE8